jgi:hypothetical protein
MMRLNYSAEEFLKIMMTLNFEKFEDGCDLFRPIRLIRHFGWFKGNYLMKQLCPKSPNLQSAIADE